MSKSFFKRGASKPSPGAAAQALIRTEEQQMAFDRIQPAMAIGDIVKVLADHGIKVWHMEVDGAKTIFFLGADAGLNAARAYAAVYGDDVH